MRVQDLDSIRIKIASPEDVLSWSKGEVLKPETINYRTQKSEKDGLFCEKIFGPEKDYECYCGKYKRIRYKGVICDRCGVEVTKSSVRRERMGHIKLATPCSHIWFLRGIPSRMGMALDISMQQMEKVIYFASYIVISVNEEAKKIALEAIDKEFKQKTKTLKSELGKEKIKKNQKVLNNKIQELKSLKDKTKEELLSIKPLKILSEIDYHNLSLKYGEVFEAGVGAESLRRIFEKINLKGEIKKLRIELEEATSISKKKVLARLRVFQSMDRADIRPEWMFLTVIPVLPPDLRPMVQIDGGRYASSDLNDLYRRVINRNNRLKYLLEISAPDVIIRNEKRMLQEAVDALIDNKMRKGKMTQASTGGRRLLKSLTDMLEGKQGRFRQNLLGKRVDYSGRSVIVVGPGLKLYQCGIPKKMALELFKPFVIKKILENELAYNVRGAIRLIEEKTDEVWAILEEIIKDKKVLLNRAPTLHRLGIQAFEPVLIEDEAIRIHPFVCSAFNADFDGDQMAVHLPLSSEAQREAKDIMLSVCNLLKPATGMPIVSPSQDIVLGCYWLTKIVEEQKGEGKIFGERKEALINYELGLLDIKAKIKVRINGEFIETSAGRIIFNEALPSSFAFQNDLMNSSKLNRLTKDIFEKYGSEEFQDALDKIKNLGFNYSTLSGISWGMDDLIVPEEKKEIIKSSEQEIIKIYHHHHKGLLSREEKKDKVIEIWQKAKSELEKIVPKTLPENGNVFQMVDSGARGTWSQPIQMAGMKGLVVNPSGEIMELPIKSCFKEGFEVLEYFISTHGARKGTADTALRTATAGYLTRRLVDIAHEIIVTEEDCGEDKGVDILREDADNINQNFVHKILGKTSLEDIKIKNLTVVKKSEIIDWKSAETINDCLEIKKVKTRSVLTCKTIRGICQKCYGWDLGLNKLAKLGSAVGIVAAQSIGEPGTQLTMRTFHSGGVAGGGDITTGLPRVQEVFEVREPKGKATISEVEGRVIEITSDRIIRIKPKIENDSKKIGRKDLVSSNAPHYRSGEKSDKIKDIEYSILPNMAIWVKAGDNVEKGQQLCEGSLDLKELFTIVGYNGTQKYITQEIQKIYVSQGISINDKHIEIIARQMFSRIKIKKSGNSSFLSGEVIGRSRFLEENDSLKKQKKTLAIGEPILLGITRVALSTDSFLSAASFQETSRVLIKASLEGKVDKLRGLKENVIIGKLIPAGTGFKRKGN